MNQSPIDATLRHFEAAEANLLKLEKLWNDIRQSIPDGVSFFSGDTPLYDDKCRSFHGLLNAIPQIDGWKPNIDLMELDAIAQYRLDAQDIGEVDLHVRVEQEINEPGKLLREYRYRLNQKRRELIRDSLISLIDGIDDDLRELSNEYKNETQPNAQIANPRFEDLKTHIAQIDTLLGSSVSRPERWSGMARHLHFGMMADLLDIINHDWPSIKAGLRRSLYGENEPIPVGIKDLSSLVSNKPQGPVTTKLNWTQLSEEELERLLFTLISSENNYEDPQWLMKTNAPDRGRDLSAFRIYMDPLGGTLRHRVIIQCKHWLSKSVGPAEVALLKEQMKLWEPPRVDVHIIATTGRFTSDAVELIEKHNQSDSALRIEMWPESQLERLLARRSAIIAEFQLR